MRATKVQGRSGRVLRPPFSLDSAHITSLLPILETLLADRNALVLGTSLAALEAICPERLDLLHKHYRRICRSLVDSDEWSQIVMLRLLERYARLHFADPSKSGKVRSALTRVPSLWFAHTCKEDGSRSGAAAESRRATLL